MVKRASEEIREPASMRVNAEMTRIFAIFSIGVAVILVGGYWYFFGIEKLFEHLAPEVILLATLFPMGYFLLWRRGILIGEQHSMKSIVSSDYVKEFFIRHDEVDWGTIIEDAREIDVVVFYYDSWVRDHHDSFVKFFRNKGKLSLVLSTPEDSVLVLSIQKHFFPALRPEELQTKIKATHHALTDAQNESGQAGAQLQVFYFPSILHYSFVLVDKRQLYLSVYEQFRGPRVRSSVFRIDLTADRQLEEHWLSNLENFKESSTQPKPWRRAA